MKVRKGGVREGEEREGRKEHKGREGRRDRGKEMERRKREREGGRDRRSYEGREGGREGGEVLYLGWFWSPSWPLSAQTISSHETVSSETVSLPH